MWRYHIRKRMGGRRRVRRVERSIESNDMVEIGLADFVGTRIKKIREWILLLFC